MCTLGFWSRVQVGGIFYTWKQALGKRGYRTYCNVGGYMTLKSIKEAENKL
jgi:hypothetical protein